MTNVAQSVYIGLGSNLEEPAEQIKRAIIALRILPQSHYVKDSGLYLSKAMQCADDDVTQADYYNAVALLETELEPLELLEHLQVIENQQGRVRSVKWAARTLDLDILLFGDLQIDTARLQIPHPGIGEREFVLYPLEAIDPLLIIPGHDKLSVCIQNCPKNGLRYLGKIE